MKLLSVEKARTVWLIDTNEFNPRGMNLRYTLLPAVVERYKFTKYPTYEPNVKRDPNEGSVLEDGVFRNAQGVDLAINLTVFRDGIVAETRSSTSETDAFLHDFFEWASKEFDLTYQLDMVKRKGYVSELIITPERSLSNLSKFENFTNKITSFVESGYATPVRYEFAGTTFAADPVSQLTPAHFRFERRLIQPFSENGYFSQAPLSTDFHLDMLNELEALLSD